MGGREAKEGVWESRGGRKQEPSRGVGRPLVAAPAGPTLEAPPSSSPPVVVQSERTMAVESLLPSRLAGLGRLPPPHREECFLVLAVWYPQGRMALGAPQGRKALWLELMTMGWSTEGVGELDLFKISLGFLMSISALFSWLIMGSLS